jgi:DNA-binding Xre family transcriptional regulator
MNFLQGLLIKLTPKRKRVREIGDVKIHEFVFSLEEASREEANLARINYQTLLPRAISEYITVRKAHEETGMSESNLRRLASLGKIEAIKVQSKWLLLRDSLNRYIQENAAS